MTSPEAHRDPHRRRRRPRSQRRHQERGVPRHRARLHGPRHPSRLGGADPCPARPRLGRRLPAAARPDQYADHRPDRRHHPAHLADEPAQDAAGAACRPGWTRPSEPATPSATGVFDLTPVVLDNLAALGIDVLVTIGGDDTLSFAQVLVDAGRPAAGDPEDDGQRRAGHRVLHRLLDGDHPGQGGRSTGSGRRSAATSASACSGSSAATPGSRRCTPRT